MWSLGGLGGYWILRRLLRGKWLFVVALLLTCRVVDAQWVTDNSHSYWSVTIDAQSGGDGTSTSNIGGAKLYEYKDVYGKNSQVREYEWKYVEMSGGQYVSFPLVNYGNYWAGVAPYHAFHRRRPNREDTSVLSSTIVDGYGSVSFEIFKSDDPHFSYVMKMTATGPLGFSKEVLGRSAVFPPASVGGAIRSAIAFADREYWDYLDQFRALWIPFDTGGANPNTPGAFNLRNPWYVGFNSLTFQASPATGKGAAYSAIVIDPPTDVSLRTPSTTQPTSQPSATTMPAATTRPSAFWDMLTFKSDDTDNRGYADRQTGVGTNKMFGEDFNKAANELVPGWSALPREANFFLCFPSQDVTADEVLTAVSGLFTHFEIERTNGQQQGGEEETLPDSITSVRGIVETAIAGFAPQSPMFPIVQRTKNMVRPVMTVALVMGFVMFSISSILWAIGMQDYWRGGEIMTGQDGQ